MRRLLTLPILAALLAVFSARVADASYSAISYQNCEGSVVSCCEVPACHTVMKTVRKVVYEPQQFTGTKTVSEVVYED